MFRWSIVRSSGSCRHRNIYVAVKFRALRINQTRLHLGEIIKLTSLREKCP